jgi:hypothetical protein
MGTKGTAVREAMIPVRPLKMGRPPPTAHSESEERNEIGNIYGRYQIPLAKLNGHRKSMF